MRPHHLLCALFFTAGAAFAAEPSGLYSYPEDILDAQACAHVCDEDALCMAWVFQGAGKCGLSAVAQAPSADSAVMTGVSANAPRFLRRSSSSTASPPPAPVAESAEPEVTTPAAQAMDDTAAEMALLGGPDETTIRSRLR